MVWDAFLEDEEVQTLSVMPKMSDLVGVIKEIKSMRQDDKNLERLRSKNAAILRREIKSVERQYLKTWEKFNEDKNYTETFLGINAHLSFLYLKYDEIEAGLDKYVRPLVLRQTKLRFKILRLEEKYENYSEIIKERRKIQDEKNALFNRQTREEINLLLPESISSSRVMLKIARKEFLQSWEKYRVNSKLEKEFLKYSNNYARQLFKVKTLEAKIRKWREAKPYNQMLRENYIRYSILEDKLVDNLRESYA